MVGVFRRSLSFPNKMMINQSRPSKPPIISHHTRSISLPCRSHPLISQLREKLAELRTWADSKPESRASAWLVNGLSRLKDLHDCLDDTLQLPQTHESLRRQPSAVVENLLEDFLRFVDAYGIFQTSILALREEQSSAEVAIRKRDESKILVYIKARKRMAKEMDKLVSAVRCISNNNGRMGSSAVVCVGDAEIVDVVNDVVEVTVVVSLAVFNGISASLTRKRGYSVMWKGLGLAKKAKAKAKAKTKTEECVIGELKESDVREWLVGLRKKSDEEIRNAAKKIRELEACVALIESGGERVFRGLINARVSLLNTLTY